MTEQWTPYVTKYDPLKCGSIDGTDTQPHDHGVVRAMKAKYRPSKNVTGDPKCTVFVAHLTPQTDEKAVSAVFKEYGDIRHIRLVRDLVTGASKLYCFVEYYEVRHAERARRDGNRQLIDGNEVLVEYELERTLSGWIPRRLGGGLGGKKEAGQLRFGGRERPFRKPIMPMVLPRISSGKDGGGAGYKEKLDRRPDNRRDRKHERDYYSKIDTRHRRHKSKERRSRSKERMSSSRGRKV